MGDHSTAIKRVVVLSGPVSCGKTTLATALHERFGFLIVRTRDALNELSVDSSRSAYQRLGDKLDKKTKGKWVVDHVRKDIAKYGCCRSIVIDSVRIKLQIDWLRRAFGSRVVHVHLTASEVELENRYKRRRSGSASVNDPKSYAEVRSNLTERRVGRLEQIADVVVDTARCSPEDVLTRIAAHLGLYAGRSSRLVDVVVGGQFGSEGKGHIVSYLAPEYEWLVRVGGPNAGHTVFEEPRPYTFHCLPSGSRCCDANLLLGPGAVISVERIMKEIGDCKIDYERLKIDPQAMVIERQDVTWEQKNLKESISSTAQGVGCATARRILNRHKPPRFAKDVRALRPYIEPACDVLERAFSENRRVLLEGTQGTGLSIFHGKYPHVTSRDTTVAGCLSEAGISPAHVDRIIMVCRTYPIRVQNPDGKGTSSGDLSQEITLEEIANRSGLAITELERVEVTSTTKRKRRIAEFDWALLRQAASLNAPTDIALTFSDYINARNRDARRFEQLTPPTIRMIQEIERVSAAPVSIISTRFHNRSIIDRRNWRRER